MSSEAVENEEKSDAGRFEKAIEASVQSLMNTYEGRWFLSYLLDSSSLLSSKYRMDGDAHGAIWRDGRASMAVTLLEFIDVHAPDQYGKLVRERRKRMERARARDEKRAEPSEFPFTKD